MLILCPWLVLTVTAPGVDQIYIHIYIYIYYLFGFYLCTLLIFWIQCKKKQGNVVGISWHALGMYLGLKTNNIWTILTWGIPKMTELIENIIGQAHISGQKWDIMIQNLDYFFKAFFFTIHTLTTGRTNSRFSSAIRGYKEISLAAAAHASAAGPRAFSPGVLMNDGNCSWTRRCLLYYQGFVIDLGSPEMDSWFYIYSGIRWYYRYLIISPMRKPIDWFNGYHLTIGYLIYLFVFYHAHR